MVRIHSGLPSFLNQLALSAGFSAQVPTCDFRPVVRSQGYKQLDSDALHLLLVITKEIAVYHPRADSNFCYTFQPL